ncbi:unnamed protein product [Schistosoma guineensis]|uniref:Prostaglandin E synthase 3 (Cytosolic) n=2 Tax=Schistosoma TaxID=6181 RepID=A0A922IT76_SCHHA|nr:Prostaglandin E synthase 3 (Cytosolic) [Schistosoma haematobium]CAH8511066.1 unnamed protein product [Schistosoma mattheei]CAH8525855.1 unnamed protein product [Schistosoma guineensis]CAH8528347.1 unnamed protein product [Schistosoma bovis]KAH9586809.1 Prostaglandin E synthase 3 (Cytosolic) [Schistosoma haematobium]CAH8531556.1 unnamed protein product [Schistosoma bovis]
MSGDRQAAVHLPVLWAQRNDCLYITVVVSDVVNKTVNVKDNSLEFRAEAGKDKPIEYEVKLDFYGNVCTEEPKITTSGREVFICIKKKENGSWPRLLSQKTKCPWLKTDFNRWKDEDDSEPDMDGNNFSNMLSQMSNFGDYGGDDGIDGDLDSDDEDLPDLEMPNADAKKSEENGTEEETEKKTPEEEALPVN